MSVPTAAVLRHAANGEQLTRERCYILELSNSEADPQVSIAQARVPAGAITRWHRLHEISERYVILEGQGRVELGTQAPQVVGPGDVVLIPAGCAQRIQALGDTALRFLAICNPRFRWQAYEDLDDAP